MPYFQFCLDIINENEISVSPLSGPNRVLSYHQNILKCKYEETDILKANQKWACPYEFRSKDCSEVKHVYDLNLFVSKISIEKGPSDKELMGNTQIYDTWI